MPLAEPLRGHYWTIAPFVRHVLFPRAVGPAKTVRIEVPREPGAPPVRLRARLSNPSGSDVLLVVVHGLGGSSDSHYVLDAAAAAHRAGVACLRVDLRGADDESLDFYHAGLSSDIAAVLSSPELAPFGHIHLLGYSLGGHVVLRYSTEGGIDERLRSVAAICPPLDLERGAAAIDRPERWVYRRHLLVALKEIAARVHARRPSGTSMKAIRSIRTIREWDTKVVAPRFGFRSAEHYYAEASVGPRLGRLGRPALLVAAEADPMVPAETLRPSLVGPISSLDVRWIDDGGHVGFPETIDLGLRGPRGLENQVVTWLREARGWTPEAG